MTPKHKYMVMKRTTDDFIVDTGRGKRRTWRQNGGKADFFYVSNEQEAKDIDAVYGNKGTQQVWVKEHGNMSWNASYKDGVHNYFNAPTKKFRDAWEEFEKRRKDKKVRARKRGKRVAQNATEVNNG